MSVGHIGTLQAFGIGMCRLLDASGDRRARGMTITSAVSTAGRAELGLQAG